MFILSLRPLFCLSESKGTAIFSSSFSFLRFSSQNVWPLKQFLAKTRK